MLIKNNFCPCGYTKPYNKCCAILHNNVCATTAEALMRSRYTAFYMNKTDYLIATTLPKQQKTLIANDIYKPNNNIKWCKLDILATKDGRQQDTTGVVEFKAWYIDSSSGLKHYYVEVSSFLKQDNRWYFVYPNELLNSVS